MNNDNSVVASIRIDRDDSALESELGAVRDSINIGGVVSILDTF